MKDMDAFSQSLTAAVVEKLSPRALQSVGTIYDFSGFNQVFIQMYFTLEDFKRLLSQVFIHGSGRGLVVRELDSGL